jgi:hypothetical protein
VPDKEHSAVALHLKKLNTTGTSQVESKVTHCSRSLTLEKKHYEGCEESDQFYTQPSEGVDLVIVIQNAKLYDWWILLEYE